MNELSPHALLAERMRARSTRFGRNDEAHLALILEGGGMRGVVSVAMASAFEERGCFSAFDSVHGSSAGACGAAYFAGGQATYGARIYFEDINNREFINTCRPLWGRPIMDKNFLIDHVMRQVKPLKTREILEAPGFLNVIATNAKSAESKLFDTFQNEQQLFEALKASICIPLIAGHSVAIEGVSYVDGGIVQQIAVQSAIDKGATHAIVLLTRGCDEAERLEGTGLQLDATALRLCYGRELEQAYRRRNREINKVIASIKTGRFPTASGKYIGVDCITRSSGCTPIGRLTKKPHVLEAGFAEGRAAAFSYIDNRITQ